MGENTTKTRRQWNPLLMSHYKRLRAAFFLSAAAFF